MTVYLAAGDAAHAVSTGMGVGHYNYWLVIVLMMTGLYVILSRSNMIKTVIGLNLFQVAIIMFYITMGKVAGGTAPIEIHALTDAQVELTALRARVAEGEVVQPPEVEAVLENIHHVAEQLPDGPVAASLHVAMEEAEALLGQINGPGGEQITAEVVTKLDFVLTELVVYSNPLPHVLMLTAIVVGIATISLALALIVRINEAYDTIEEDEILALEAQS